uniref:Uncharacterized protein n=1 Tax=Aegilops tauschii TaxID=37682 RepID=M8B510_AEGTA
MAGVPPLMGPPAPGADDGACAGGFGFDPCTCWFALGAPISISSMGFTSPSP